MNAEARLAALRARIEAHGLGAFLVTGPANVRYLTGFEDAFDAEPNAACVVTAATAAVYTDFRYAEAVRVAASGTPWSVRVTRDTLYAEVCHDLDGAESGLLGIESSVPHGRFKFVSERCGGRILATEHWVEELRAVKDAAELERIEAAARLTDEAMAHATQIVTAGRTEADIALEVEVFMRRNGSDGVAFEPIVAAGPNSAKPHALPSARPVEAGDLLIVDIGARVGGYCADLTRTFCVGPASERQRELHSAVLEAQQAGLRALHPGVVGREPDQAARDALAARGLGDAFGHGLGHGVGLDVHELPTLGSRSRDALLSGSVVTVEPGVYLPGEGGARIEDLVVVEDGGVRMLSAAPRELLEIG